MSNLTGRRARPPTRRSASLRAAVEAHPCNACPDAGRHLHFRRRALRLEREIAGIDSRIRGRTATLARRFEQVLNVLEGLGYVTKWQLTSKGEALARVYNEADLLIVEALEQHVFDGLDASSLAAVLSSLVYEPRGPEPELVVGMPTAATQRVWRALLRLHDDIRAEEEAHDLDLTREPDAGFAEQAHLWASGSALDDVLEDMAPGDFVRTTKQVIDLLRQLEEVTGATPLQAKVTEAVRRLQRGVVAYSSLEH